MLAPKPALARASAERAPRARSAGPPSPKLPKPPQGHSGFKRRLERKPPRSSGAPRYETTNAKQRMLASALELAEQRGYESLRISDITDPVGVQRQAFYSHFRDKRHCLCEAIDPKLRAVLELATGEEDAPRWAEQVVSAIDETLAERFHSPDGTRGRLVATMIEMLRETESFDTVRIGKLVKRAHVPNADFYRQFSGKRECFAVAYEEILDGLAVEVRSQASEGDPAEPRSSFTALLTALGSALTVDPVRLRLLVIEAAHLPDLPSQDVAGAWRGSFGSSLVGLLAGCAADGVEDPRLPFVAGSLVETIRAAVVAHDVGRMTERLIGAGEGLGISAQSNSVSDLAA